MQLRVGLRRTNRNLHPLPSRFVKLHEFLLLITPSFDSIIIFTFSSIIFFGFLSIPDRHPLLQRGTHPPYIMSTTNLRRCGKTRPHNSDTACSCPTTCNVCTSLHPSTALVATSRGSHKSIRLSDKINASTHRASFGRNDLLNQGPHRAGPADYDNAVLRRENSRWHMLCCVMRSCCTDTDCTCAMLKYETKIKNRWEVNMFFRPEVAVLIAVNLAGLFFLFFFFFFFP